MTDTPRTDEIYGRRGSLVNPMAPDYVEFARSLERELRAKTQECERLKFKADYVDRRMCADHAGKWMPGRCLLCEIERLREALDAQPCSCKWYPEDDPDQDVLHQCLRCAAPREKEQP